MSENPSISHRRMALRAVRYGVPVTIGLAAIGVALGVGGRWGLAGAALLASAAITVFLLNVLFRLSWREQKDREREEEARREFERTGRWPRR